MSTSEVSVPVPVPAKVPPLHAYVLDPLERAASTFVEQAGALLVPMLMIVGGGISINSSDLLKVVDVSTFAALVSLITSILTFRVPVLPPFLDLLGRTGKTYIQSFLGYITTAAFVPSVLHTDWRTALLAAVPVALLAFLKGLASLAAPWSIGSSLLPSPGLQARWARRRAGRKASRQLVEHLGRHEAQPAPPAPRLHS